MKAKLSKSKAPLSAIVPIGMLILAAGAVAWNAHAETTSSTSANEKSAVVYEMARPDLSDLIRAVKPAVVSIGVEKNVTPTGHLNGAVPFGPSDEFFRRFFGRDDRQFGSPPPARKMMGQGSGFVFADDGYIVTNQHVVEGSDKITVTFEDGSTLPGILVGSDAKTDLAVVKVEPTTPLPFVRFGDSDKAEVGDWVVAIGNPFGFGGSATAGIISARGRDLRSESYVDFLQIDAPINSGNSGGPIFDEHGEVIGINTAIYSPNGGNVGLGFAIPAADAVDIIDTLKNEGQVSHGWLGVQIQNLDDELAEGLDLESSTGALIVDVVPDSPAAKAGLIAGDVVRRFGDIDVGDAKDLSRSVARADRDHPTPMSIIRDGKRKTLKVRIRAAATEQVAAAMPADKAALGLAIAPLTDADRSALGLSADATGVVVSDVEPNSDAATKGIRRGDVIVRINDQMVKSVKDVSIAVKDAERADRHFVAMLVQRGESKRFVSVNLA